MDLHTHTPGSSDYLDVGVSYLDILQQAERRGLNIIAFTDHNTVKGFRETLEEVDRLRWLYSAGRANPEESYRLNEYNRLFEKLLILPGFEFTAMFGFHILGIFSPDTEVRYLEHLLLDLRIPPDLLDSGETNVGATSDVLTAYHAIREAGGIVIAAHANSTNGVAMRGFPLGGQTRIAYTQDPNLHCLEVTDLEKRVHRTTRRFFDGSKPEYPRAMRCIQGSDAHRLQAEKSDPKHLGVGERVTEIRLGSLSFEEVYGVLGGNDFARTRPYRGSTAPFDHVLAARQEGPSIVQDFHPKMTKRGGYLYAVIADICAFANGNGGTLYIGVSPDPKEKPVGVQNINQAVSQIIDEIDRTITPPLEVNADILKTEGGEVIRIQVSPGTEPPYAIDGNKIYVRGDDETSVAVRDEIVQLVLRGQELKGADPISQTAQEQSEPSTTPEFDHRKTTGESATLEPPRTGVEIVATEKRGNTLYHHVRDLRNGNIVRNVTRESARKLWHYAIAELEAKHVDTNRLKWQGDIAIVKSYKVGGRTRYDLAQRESGRVRVYFGVTDDGIQDSGHESWRALVGSEEEE
jgi:hypothetical protein